MCVWGGCPGEAPGIADTVSAYHLLEEGEEVKYICQVCAKYQAFPSFPSGFAAMDQGGHYIIILIDQIRKQRLREV